MLSVTAALDADDVRDALEQLAQFGLPSSGMAHHFDVGSGPFLQFVRDELYGDLLSNKGATCKVVEGPYGSGKSHVLQLLEDSALASGMAVARTELSAAQHLEDWHLIAKFILQNIELQTERGIVRSLPRVIDALVSRNGQAVPALNPSSLPHQGFARAMVLLANRTALRPSGDALLRRFLEGERVSATDLKANGVTGVKQPVSKRNAELVVKTVLAGLKRLGVTGTLLLFDENEHTFAFAGAAAPKKVRVAANLLRRLIDGAATGSLSATLVVFAVLPGFIENCALAYPALGQRLHRDPSRETVGWRSPVLPVDSLIANQDPDAFVEAFVNNVETALTASGLVSGPAADRTNALLNAGRQAVRLQAGSGYRRNVVKHVAAHALRHI